MATWLGAGVFEWKGRSGPFPKISPSSHALSLLPHSGFILSVSSRFLARRASSWASRRVELRASALTCLAKAWRSSSWGEERRCSWGLLDWAGGGGGAGLQRAKRRVLWGPHFSLRVSHHALSLRLTPASHNALVSRFRCGLNLCLSYCLSHDALTYVPASTKSVSIICLLSS